MLTRMRATHELMSSLRRLTRSATQAAKMVAAHTYKFNPALMPIYCWVLLMPTKSWMRVRYCETMAVPDRFQYPAGAGYWNRRSLYQKSFPPQATTFDCYRNR